MLGLKITLMKNITKRFKEALNDLKKISAVSYACEADAKNAFSRYLIDHSFVIPVHSNISTVHKRANGKRGRPKEGETLISFYQIEATIEINTIQIEKERKYLGRFVLATNNLDLNPETILHHYKGQMLVEKGFRFLKDKSFRVAEVYLKSEKRIEALCMVMVLCLMIYSYTEWLMRKRLQEEDETVLDQKKRPTKKPTMKWIYFKFREIQSCTVRIANSLQSYVHTINSEHLKILFLLGPEYEKFYI